MNIAAIVSFVLIIGLWCSVLANDATDSVTIGWTVAVTAMLIWFGATGFPASFGG